MVEDKDINAFLESLTADVNVVLCRAFSLCGLGSALAGFFLYSLWTVRSSISSLPMAALFDLENKAYAFQ